MRRWIGVLLLLAAVLGSNVWNVHCGPQLSGIGSDLPDCCRDGMCPHHAGDSRESGSCPHSMSSGASVSLVVQAAMPATIQRVAVHDYRFAAAGAVVELSLNSFPEPSPSPITPPPRKL